MSRVIKICLVLTVVVIVCLYYNSQTPKITTEVITSEQSECPTDATFTEMWNRWSFDYINENPMNGIEAQMQDWNTLMVQNNCGEEWFDPLADLIEQQRASATPVYWEYDSN